MPEYPDLDEFVLATVQKITPYGAICSLDEYGGVEAFIHISEVSAGWIRNIREHLKEGQKIVAKVVFTDRAKHQIDLSLKRVTDVERKRKMEAAQSEKRAQKLFERAAAQLVKPLRQLSQEAGEPLAQEFGSLWKAFEALAQGIEPKTKIPKQYLTVLKEIAGKEIKPKKVEVRATLSLQSFDGNGLERIKKVLEVAGGTCSEGVSSRIHYVSAPLYFVDVTAPDYKTAEKFLQKIEGVIEQASKQEDVAYALEKAK